MRSLVQTTIIFLVVVCSQSLLAAPGDIDTTFGVIGGYTVTDLAGAQVDERPNDVAIQPDGKIVVVGYRDGAIDFTSDHLVTRFNADGSLDTTFSGDGYFTLTGVGQYGSALAVAIQSDGKIVVAGGAGDGGGGLEAGDGEKGEADGQQDGHDREGDDQGRARVPVQSAHALHPVLWAAHPEPRM